MIDSSPAPRLSNSVAPTAKALSQSHQQQHREDMDGDERVAGDADGDERRNGMTGGQPMPNGSRARSRRCTGGCHQPCP